MTENEFAKGKADLEKRIQDVITSTSISLPEGPHENKIQNWWYSDEDIKDANRNGKMLTLDLDIGSVCHYDCGFCFAKCHRDNSSTLEQKTLKLKAVIDEAASLGAKNIKIVGAGEPTLYPDLLEIVEYANDKYGIKSTIFTTGDIFGNDKMASRVYAKKKVKSGLDLAKRFFEAGSSVIVKYMTLDRRKEKEYCGVSNSVLDNKVNGITNLIKTGFNSSPTTRLGVDFLLIKGIQNSDGTVTEGNAGEAVESFKLFNNYNIFVVLNTSMDCGNTSLAWGQNGSFKKGKKPLILSQQEAYEVARDLYVFANKKGIPFDRRISPYFLAPACSQLNHGMYVADNGLIKSCPGQPLSAQEILEGKTEASIGLYQNTGSLAEAWKRNPYRFSCIAHKCISRCGKTYLTDFEDKIRKEIQEKNAKI